MSALGNPHRDLRVVQVAGTNGKGSTALIIARVLSAAGYRTGRYSSPHLHSYCERFEIDGQIITPDKLHAYLKQVLRVAESLPVADQPSEFEILTAVALLYFKEEGIDVVVLETGLGGRYDATTVATPLLCAITTVDYDHTSWLGDSLAEIAANKAGIIKAGIPVVVGPMDEEAWQIIAVRAHSLHSPLLSSAAVSITSGQPHDLRGQCISMQAGNHNLQQIWFSLPGAFQLQNLAVAMTALVELEKYSFIITDEYIKSALGKLHTEGRLEVLSESPLILCDAAHNRQAAQALHSALAELLPGREKVLLCGMVDDKDAGGILEYLGSDSKACVVTRPLGQRSQYWQRTAAEWGRLYPQIPCRQEEDIVKAVELSLSFLSADAYLLLTGSFYVIDKARQYLLATHCPL